MLYRLSLSTTHIRIYSEAGALLLEEPAAVACLYNPKTCKVQIVEVGSKGAELTAKNISNEHFPQGEWVDVIDVAPERAHWLEPSYEPPPASEPPPNAPWECTVVWPLRDDRFGSFAWWAIECFCERIDRSHRTGFGSRFLKARYEVTVEEEIGPVAHDNVFEYVASISRSRPLLENGQPAKRKIPRPQHRASLVDRTYPVTCVLIVVSLLFSGRIVSWSARIWVVVIGLGLALMFLSIAHANDEWS